MTTAHRDRGQAVVEFAIALPLVVVLVLGVVQVAAIVGDQLAIELAAREGARAAAVSASPASAASAAADAATGLRPIDTSTAVGASTVTVTVRHTSRTDVPLLGLAIGDVTLDASVTMRREPP